MEFGESALPDVDLAPPPPIVALLAGRVLSRVPEEFILGARGLAPSGNDRCTLDGFTIVWAVLAQCALDRACAQDASRHHRAAYGIAGIALACLIAEQSPTTWHANGLDDRLRAVALSTGLPADLCALARRAALHRLAASDAGVFDVLARLEDQELPALEAELPVREKIERMAGPIRDVAVELLKRHPKFMSAREMITIYGRCGNTSKASTIANMLRRRHGIALESATEARRRNPKLAGSLGKGYRLTEPSP